MSQKRQRTDDTDHESQLTQFSMPSYSQSTVYGSRRRRFRGLTSRYPARRRRSYTSRVPRSVTPYNFAYPIARNINIDAPINLSTGWQARGPGLGFSFRLSEMVMQYSDGTAISKPFGGYTELTALFDQWRIAKVECKIIYSASNHNQVLQLPMRLRSPSFILSQIMTTALSTMHHLTLRSIHNAVQSGLVLFKNTASFPVSEDTFKVQRLPVPPAAIDQLGMIVQLLILTTTA